MMSGRFLLRISLLALLGFHHCEAAPPEKEDQDNKDTTAAGKAEKTIGGRDAESFSETERKRENGMVDKVVGAVEPVPPVETDPNNPTAGEANGRWIDGPSHVKVDPKFTEEEVAKAHQKCEKLGGGNLNNDRKLTEVWKEMVECANGLVKMGQGLQTQLDDAHVAGMDYLKSYTGAYSTLTYLKGDDMLNALEKSHNSAIEAMDKEVDGVDDILKDIQPYTKYGHQKDDAPPARVRDIENPGAAEARKKAIEEANQAAKEAEAASLKAEADAEAARLKAEAARLKAEADAKAAKANAAEMKANELKSREQVAEQAAQQREQMAALAKSAADKAQRKADEKLDAAEHAKVAEAQTAGLSGSSRESSEERWPELSAQTAGLSGSSRESSEERWPELSAQTAGLSGSSRESSEERWPELSASTASALSDGESPRGSDNGAAAEAAMIKRDEKQAVLAAQAAEIARAKEVQKEDKLARHLKEVAQELGGNKLD